MDRARTLASDRAEEYPAHRSLLHRATKSLTASPSVSKPATTDGSSPFSEIPTWGIASGISVGKFGSHIMALTASFLIVGSSALVVHTPVVSAFAMDTGEVVLDVLYGFGETFGDIQSDIASRIDGAKDEMSTVSSRVASRAVLASLDTVSPLLTQPDFSPPQIAVTDTQRIRVASEFGNEASQATSVAPMFTVDDAQAFALQTYALISSPTRAVNAFMHAYVALGEQMYIAITSSFTAYDSLIKKSGVQTLALAGTTRDVLAHAPELITRMNLALGESVIKATHTAIQADVSLAYGTAAAAPASAQVVTAFIGNTGDVLARATAHTAVETAARTAFILRGFGDGLYEGTKSIQDVLYTTGPLLANLPTTIENAYLGIFGKSALALQSLKSEIGLAFNSISTELQSNTQLAAVLAAVQPVLAPGERLALAVYESVQALFDSATNTLATIIAPSPIIILPNVPSRFFAIATSSEFAPSPFLSGDNESTTTPYITVVQGVSSDYMNQSLASFRSDILTTVAGLVQPVSNQTGTNSNTIQYVNMIQDLTNLIVRNGDFRGGTFDNATRISATGGNFTSLTGGTTNLGATTINGSLIVNGVLITGSSAGNVATSTAELAGNLPYWTSTAGTPAALGSAANLNWNNSISLLSVVGNASTTQLTATSSVYLATLGGRVGIGTTTPAVALDIYATDAIRLPVGSTVQRPTTGGTGFVRYNITTHQFEGYGDNSVWQGLGGVIDADQDTYITADTNNTDEDTLRLFTFGNQRMTIANTGNVGIGTTSPYALLSLAGSSSGTSNLFALSTSTAAFATTTALTIDQNGNLALLNGANLAVGGNLTVTGTTAQTGLTTFSNGFISNASSTITSGLFTMSGGASTTQFTTTGNTYLATLGGNVGIGTTSPSATLSVHGTGYFSGSAFFGGAITATSTLNVSGLTTLGYASTTQISSTGFAYFATSGGNVGIGTTSPGQKLGRRCAWK